VLITTIQKENKRTEELEEAGYRSPTWAVLRALQQINSATRIEGEAAISAPPFFLSAGRGDLFFWWKKKDKWKSYGTAYQNKERQVGWTRQAGRTTGSCGAS